MAEKSYSEFQAEVRDMPVSAGPRLVAILDYIRETLDGVTDEIGIEAVIAQFNELYDTFVAPVDIPFVPNLVEPLVDAQIKKVLAQLIRGFHDMIHKN